MIHWFTFSLALYFLEQFNLWLRKWDKYLKSSRWQYLHLIAFLCSFLKWFFNHVDGFLSPQLDFPHKGQSLWTFTCFATFKGLLELNVHEDFGHWTKFSSITCLVNPGRTSKRCLSSIAKNSSSSSISVLIGSKLLTSTIVMERNKEKTNNYSQPRNLAPNSVRPQGPLVKCVFNLLLNWKVLLQDSHLKGCFFLSSFLCLCKCLTRSFFAYFPWNSLAHK